MGVLEETEEARSHRNGAEGVVAAVQRSLSEPIAKDELVEGFANVVFSGGLCLSSLPSISCDGVGGSGRAPPKNVCAILSPQIRSGSWDQEYLSYCSGKKIHIYRVQKSFEQKICM
jgi:hypothetical protein